MFEYYNAMLRILNEEQLSELCSLDIPGHIWKESLALKICFFWLNNVSNVAEVGFKDSTRNNSNQGRTAGRDLRDGSDGFIP